MPKFLLMPDEHDFEAVEVEVADAGQVLPIVHRLGWNGARVLQDGEPRFSISLNPQGFWSIVQGLPEDAEDETRMEPQT